ncbi:uncharacterized protein DS421_2g48200 [Arachis hypogaea]|nr:uncharacterized protein DS421_2g48200 [Arachis hypogaea]
MRNTRLGSCCFKSLLRALTAHEFSSLWQFQLRSLMIPGRAALQPLPSVPPFHNVASWSLFSELYSKLRGETDEMRPECGMPCLNTTRAGYLQKGLRRSIVAEIWVVGSDFIGCGERAAITSLKDFTWTVYDSHFLSDLSPGLPISLIVFLEIEKEKLKEKQKVVEVNRDDLYRWVDDDVKTRASSFPFSSFECDVLTQLNCAPSQLHPNSWAFLKAFPCLMSFLEYSPTLGVFFSLFQSKGVRSKETEYPFYLDDELFEKFPLYWCSEPMQILEAYRSEEEDLVIDFLVNNFAAGKCLSIFEMLRLENENNREGLRTYIGGRVPHLTSSRLQSFLDKKKEKVSIPKIDEDIAFSTARPVSSKRKREESETSVEVLSEGGNATTEDPSLAFDCQRKLHGFVPRVSPHSLWSDQYPFAELSDRASQYPGDMVIAARMLCVGRTTELLGAEQVDVEKFAALERAVKEKDKVIIDITAKMKEKEEAANDVVAKLEEKEKEVTRLQDQIRSFQAEIRDNDKTKGEMTARNHKLEDQGIEMFTSGFDRAVSQISLFAPEFDVCRLDVTKIVVGEKLVQDEAGENHDENVSPPV